MCGLCGSCGPVAFDDSEGGCDAPSSAILRPPKPPRSKGSGSGGVPTGVTRRGKGWGGEEEEEEEEGQSRIASR